MTEQTEKTRKKLSAEQISTRVLYAAVTLTVAVFGAFFFIGYDIPYEENPEFNAPMLTDAVLVFIYILVFAAVALAAVAVFLSVRMRDKSQDEANNIPAAKIAWGTAALLAVTLVMTFISGSSEPVPVNGTPYTNTLWLKATDMFINTSIVLLAVALGGVAFGLSGYNRKLK